MEDHLEAQPLSGLRVIDLTHGIAGPYCTKLLAHYGAQVVKVERPGSGDFARSLGPFPGDTPHPEKSGLFLHLNMEKRSVVLDLKTPQGMQTVKDLAREADVLVESFRPGVMERLELGYGVLSQINPDLVVTHISNFGQTGPYQDYQASELTLSALGTAMHRRGFPERYPLMLTSNHVQFQAGNVAAMATLFAWYTREHRDTRGQEVDVSIMETQMASVNGAMTPLLQYQYTGERTHRMQGTLIAGYPQGYYPCSDGYILISAGFRLWAKTVAMLGRPELLQDPHFSTREAHADPYRKEEFEGEIWLPWVLERTMKQAVEECQAYEILCAPIHSIADAMDNNPQAEARDYFVKVDHPHVGTLRYPGAPIYAPKGWWRIRRHAPLLGEHTQEVLEKGWGVFQKDGELLGSNQRSPTSAERTTAPPSTSRRGRNNHRPPLEGIRVLDITYALAGPYSTVLLGDLGAEVIRLEPRSFIPLGARGMLAKPNKELEKRAPTSPYPNRDPGERPWNRGANFNTMARNKHSITVELATPEGKETFRRLVEVSDLFIQNSAYGAMERLGFTNDVLSQWNPRLSMISVCGLGQTGPWREYRGWGSNFEAIYGFSSITGYPDMDTDGVPNAVPSDPATGVTIAQAAIMALQQRERTGKGCFVDIALGEVFAAHLGDYFLDYEMNHRLTARMGNRHLQLVQGAYRCAGDDEWVTLTIGRIEQWDALCRLMGSPELIEDERFADMASLRAHHDEVDAIISEWTAQKNNLWLFHRLQREGIPAAPVMHEPMAYTDPQLRERRFFVEITQADTGTHLYPSTVYKLSKVPFVVRKPPVRLGEDNDYVYRNVLKFTKAEYDQLKDLGHIGMDYAPHVP